MAAPGRRRDLLAVTGKPVAGHGAGWDGRGCFGAAFPNGRRDFLAGASLHHPAVPGGPLSAG